MSNFNKVLYDWNIANTTKIPICNLRIFEHLNFRLAAYILKYVTKAQFKYTFCREKFYYFDCYKIVLTDKNQQTRITGTHSQERSTNHIQYTTTRTVSVEDLHNGSSLAFLPTSTISPLTDTGQENSFPIKSRFSVLSFRFTQDPVLTNLNLCMWYIRFLLSVKFFSL